MPDKPSNIPSENKSAFRIHEAQHASGLSRSTLYDLMAKGQLRSTKVGGRRLILRTDLEALLQAGTR